MAFGDLTLLDQNKIFADASCVYRAVWGDGNYVYAAYEYTANGIVSYSVDGSGNLTPIDNKEDGGIYRAVHGNGSHILTGGLRSYSVDGLGNLTNLDYNASFLYGNATNIYWDGNFFLVVDTSGVHTVSVDGAGIITELDYQIFDLAGATGIWGDGNFVYVARYNGMATISVDGGGNISIVDTVGTPSALLGCWADGTYVYSGDYSLAYPGLHAAECFFPYGVAAELQLCIALCGFLHL